MYDQNDPKSVELYSSAATLSDMEIFIFPELLYGLVLANIMSPRLWEWKSDPWFRDTAKLSPLRRMHRLKQFIMDRFAFNLDLETWGLTTKEQELARFSRFIDVDVLSRSNALFGYEGDKYYFDIDIRKHFGLDKYTSDVIPYWKTETLEAMEAFCHKKDYPAGAGECVSLAALYSAAAFVVADIPLQDIYLLGTPLHSQNFIDAGGGLLTNNRRIVTKTMWFNGTEISAKARRALENEQITVVAHATGYIHSMYPNATISQERFNKLSGKLSGFLSADRIDFEILANFLRDRSKLQRCFQIRHVSFGKPRYIEAEKVFAYEHASKARVSDATREHLLGEIESDEFYTAPIPNRLIFDELESFFKTTNVSLDKPDTLQQLKQHLSHSCFNADQVMPDLQKFCRTAPRLPVAGEKEFSSTPVIDLDGIASAFEARERVIALSKANETCGLALAAYRDLDLAPWKPFLKAALERNPVSVSGAGDLSIDQAFGKISAFVNESIYAEPSRVAQPDEVWNYGRGDGIEKAITLANIIRSRDKNAQISMERTGDTVTLVGPDNKPYSFVSAKTVRMPDGNDFA